MNRTSFSQRHGFTLIELLVVIAIISLLVSILLPSLNKAKELARQTVCMSNIRSIGMGMTLYLQENEQTFPQSGQGSTWGSYMWKGRLRDYLGLQPGENLLTIANFAESVFRCPSLEATEYGTVNRCMRVAYMPNAGSGYGVIGPTAGQKVSKIQTPLHELFVMPECNVDVTETNNDGYIYRSSAISTYTYTMFSERHMGKTNVLFGDNHIEAIPVDDLYFGSPHWIWKLHTW